MQKLLLIDGNAMIHRAYHALPPLTNTKGEPVQAVYGFFSMLLNVIVDQKPTHLVVCFDRGAPTIRQTMFAGYHIHRPELADEFVHQIGLIHELLGMMNVEMFELDGYEGDDLIGTIATKAVEDNTGPVGRDSRVLSRSHSHHARSSEASFNELRVAGALSPVPPASSGIEVIILTGDRDMLQLVNEKVKVLMPLVGISKTVLFDEKAVEEKYGVHPRQFVDYKALIGDPSDGYPGVTGIGPKTASSLLQKYGTFEDLYTKIPELPEKMALKLATDAEQAALAKKLAKIITDSPIQFDLKKCLCSDFTIKKLIEGFQEQGFKNLTARFETVFGKVEEQLGLL